MPPADKQPPAAPAPSGLWAAFRRFLHERFSLDEDKDEEAAILQSISRGIEFRGINPSTYLGYQLVRKTIFEQNAKRFVDAEVNSQARQLLGYKARFSRLHPTLELTLVGEPMPADSLARLKSVMPRYDLDNINLVVKQGNFKDANVDVDAITSTVTNQVIQYSQASIARKDHTIDPLRRQIERTNLSRLLVANLRDELRTLLPDVRTFTASRALLMTTTSTRPDTLLLVYARFNRPHTRAEKQRIENWLRSRTKSNRVNLVVE